MLVQYLEWRNKEKLGDFVRGKIERGAVLEFGPNGFSVSKTRPWVFKRISSALKT